MNDTIWVAIYRRPVTGLVSCLVAGVSLLIWAEGLFVGTGVIEEQPWILITSILPHLDFFHLVFNLYWFCVFGNQIEGAFGSVKTGLLLLVLAIGSSLAQYAFDNPGVGLSGVGFGYFAFCFVLARSDARFAAVVPRRIALLFTAWFFFCIGMTVAGVWPVGNYAHAGGMLFGALIGAGVTAHTTLHRRLAGLGVAVTILALGLAATTFRPYINSSAHETYALACAGRRSLDAKQYRDAVDYLEQAVERQADVPDWWFLLGIAYSRAKRYQDAVHAYEKAVALAPQKQEYRDALADLKKWRSEYDYEDPAR